MMRYVMERGLKFGTCIFRNALQLKTLVNHHSLALTRYATPWHRPYSQQQNHFLSSFDQPSPYLLLKFHSLEPKRSRETDPKLPHLSKLSKFDSVNGFPRTFFFRKKPREPKKKRVPKLVLLQNPFTWLMTKIDFRVLRSVWDPSFTEKDFKYGTRQAISRVTNLISGGHYAELNGLLTKPARSSLMRELERNWNERQRSLLALQTGDIQISSPRKVYFIRIADKKYCDVDMAFLALKWVPLNSIEALIFTEIFARFHREYTPHCIPEWTIAYFKVTRFQVLRKQTRDDI